MAKKKVAYLVQITGENGLVWFVTVPDPEIKMLKFTPDSENATPIDPGGVGGVVEAIAEQFGEKNIHPPIIMLIRCEIQS